MSGEKGNLQKGQDDVIQRAGRCARITFGVLVAIYILLLGVLFFLFPEGFGYLTAKAGVSLISLFGWIITYKKIILFLSIRYGSIPSNAWVRFPSSEVDAVSLPFLGRGKELNRIEEFLKGKNLSGILHIRGQGGSGKTRLALEKIRRYNDWMGKWATNLFRRKWIVFYWNFSDTGEVSSNLDRMKEWGSFHHLIVILDNYFDANSEHRDLIRNLNNHLANKNHRFRVIVLSNIVESRDDDERDTIILRAISYTEIQDDEGLTDDIRQFMADNPGQGEFFPIEIYFGLQGGFSFYIKKLIGRIDVGEGDSNVLQALIYLFLRSGGIDLGELKAFGVERIDDITGVTGLIEGRVSERRLSPTVLDTVGLGIALHLLCSQVDGQDVLRAVWKQDGFSMGYRCEVIRRKEFQSLCEISDIFEVEDDALSEDADLARSRIQGYVNQMALVLEQADCVKAYHARVKTISGYHAGDDSVGEACSLAMVNAMNAYGIKARFSEMEEAFGVLERHVTSHPESAVIQELLAKGAFNAVSAYGMASKFSEMGKVFGVLESHAANHAKSAVIQEELAKGAFNAVGYYGEASEFTEMGKVFGVLKSHAKSHAESAVIQEDLAKGAVNVVYYYGKSSDFPKLEDAFGVLVEHATSHPDNDAIQELLAMGAYNTFFRTFNEPQSALRERALKIFQTVAERFPFNGDIQERHAEIMRRLSG